jgi:hypothetical protein
MCRLKRERERERERRGNWLSQFKLLYVTLSLVDLLPLFTEKEERREET